MRNYTVEEKSIAEHVTPVRDTIQLHKDMLAELWAHCGHLVTQCQHCGGARMKDYVCACGWQVAYAEAPAEAGKLEKVWQKITYGD